MTVITNMPMYQAMVLIHALKFYRDTGMKVNRAYTPTNMLSLAGEITGLKFRRGQFNNAIAALDAWLQERKTEGQHLQTDTPPVMMPQRFAP